MPESERVGILGEISNWLKLLGLIVLVAESIMIAAMSASPKDHPLYNWYPVLMLLFLAIIVAALFFDRYTKRRSDEILTLTLGDRRVSLNTTEMRVSETAVEHASQNHLYSDSQKGFMFELPASAGWTNPQHMDTGAMLMKLGLIPDEASVEQARTGAVVIPMGQMLFEASNIFIEHGEPLSCEITDETSNTVIDTILTRLLTLIESNNGEKPTEEEIIETRRAMLLQNYRIDKFKLRNVFAIHVYDKQLAAQSPVYPNLGNFFVMLTRQQGGTIDKLVANEDSVLWGSQQTLTNVRVGNALREVTTYTMNALFENARYLFELNIIFSPQTNAPISVWDDLKNMFGSFKVSAPSS